MYTKTLSAGWAGICFNSHTKHTAHLDKTAAERQHKMKRMLPLWACAALALVATAAFGEARAVENDVAREIDAQVWIPMLAASDRFDAEGFLAVQSPDLVRVSIDRNEVYGLDRYSRELVAGFARARERGIARRSDIRFLTRTHSNGLARDTGIFRSETVMPNGEKRLGYTAFEMILRKEQERWKILVDQDTTRGGAISEADYQKGGPLNRAPLE